MSGEDGYAIRVDGSEKILNPKLSGMTGNLTTGEIAKLSQDYLNGKLVNKFDAQQIGGQWMDNKAVLDKFDSLEKTIRNKPENEYHMEEVVDNVFAVIKKQTRGNTVSYNRYRKDL